MLLELSEKFGTDEHTMSLILEGLRQSEENIREGTNNYKLFQIF